MPSSLALHGRARAEPEDAPLTLREVLSTLTEARRLIMVSAAVAGVVGVALALTAKPVFRAEALLQVDGRHRGMDPLEESAALMSMETPTTPEVDIIRSRRVVGKVVQALGLDITVSPADPWSAGRLLGREDRVRLSRLELPPELHGEPLTLGVEEEPGSYRLLASDGRVLLRGRVNQEEQVGALAVTVVELEAPPGERFWIQKEPLPDAVDRFSQRLSVSEKGKGSGLIELRLEGPEPAQLRETLDALMAAYLEQDVERRTAEAAKRLTFAESQLPVLKANLDEAELKLEQYRQQRGHVDLGLQAKAIVDGASELRGQMTLLELEHAELRQRFTEAHPQVVALQQKLMQLRRNFHRVESQAEALPSAELSWIRLNRDVKVANELYMQLLARAQELNVWKSGRIAQVRVIDRASSSSRPVRPRRLTTVLMSLLAGAAAGTVAAFARRTLRRGVESAEVLERSFQLPVYACIPRRPRRWRASPPTPVVVQLPRGEVAESLRQLRTGLQHALGRQKKRLVVVTAAREGVGRSFVCANLAWLFAATHRHVLLVEGDLRNAPLRRYFPDAPARGLSELVQGGSLEALITPTGWSRLDYLDAGGSSDELSEQLCGPGLEVALQRMVARYDVVLVCAPPLLAAAEASVFAQAGGVNLLVVDAGEDTHEGISRALALLDRSGAALHGFVVNRVMEGRGPWSR